MKIRLNVSEGAEYAGVCRDTIYSACERGELHHIRIGGRRSIRLKRGSGSTSGSNGTPAKCVQARRPGSPATRRARPARVR